MGKSTGPIDFQYVCSLPPGINTTAKSIGITSYQLSNLFCLQDALYILQRFLQPAHLSTGGTFPPQIHPPSSQPLRWQGSEICGSKPRHGEVSQLNEPRPHETSSAEPLLRAWVTLELIRRETLPPWHPSLSGWLLARGRWAPRRARMRCQTRGHRG